MTNPIKLVWYILIVGLILIQGVDGSRIAVEKKRNINKAIIKTIESEDGDIIDCFDIYKQPAFDHPLLRNHTIQMKPKFSYPNQMKGRDNTKFELVQTWHKFGECPDGTVPIRRAQGNDLPFSQKLRKRRPHHYSNSSTTLEDDPNDHEYAFVAASSNIFYGAQAKINVWNPSVELDSELSISQIWVSAGQGSGMTTVEAGWTVNPFQYHDKRSRLFIYWTSDNYHKTGCYDLSCPGFVQTNKQITLGSVIKPVSSYNEDQYTMSVRINKDGLHGNWWLVVQDVELGYWPKPVIPNLYEGATGVEWGGEIVNDKPSNRHTTTEMGSGHFPSEGYKKASFFRNLGIIDGALKWKNPENLHPSRTATSCYDVELVPDHDPRMGVHFYYGGPGLSRSCP